MSQDKAASTDELVYLQRVDLAKTCYLQEVLYWIAFGRLPNWLDNLSTHLIHMHIRPMAYNNGIDDALTDEEYKKCTPPLPPDPRTKYDWTYGVALCDDLAAMEGTADIYLQEQDESVRKDQARIEAANLYKEISEWRPKYERAIELAAAKIYTALREGRLTSIGRRLPDLYLAVSLKMLSEQGKVVVDLEKVAIPKEFWSLQGILWEDSAARNDSEHYCLIHCPTEEVMLLFPPEAVTAGKPVDGLMQHGSFFVLSSHSAAGSSARSARRSKSYGKQGGRPVLYPWPELAVEMAALAQSGPLPKKESAIAHLRGVCEKRGWPVPAISTTREWLDQFYVRLKRD